MQIFSLLWRYGKLSVVYEKVGIEEPVGLLVPRSLISFTSLSWSVLKSLSTRPFAWGELKLSMAGMVPSYP